ncbi:MAG: DUF3592 domain-containing protein [Alphaproteobacteria bacterium]|nr:DUF3592 domain-containing protein [Alphaproteobacteria bacterium]MCB9695293.1 DUF3592 domain-containing protein [Alphaproteobacteria bacterium]
MNGSASASWPTVDATITESRVDVQKHRRRSNGRNRETTTYEARIRYTYSAGGREHTHWRLAFASDEGYSGLGYLTAEQRANAMVADHPRGAHVQVAVDPSDPDVAVLHPGVQTSEALKLGLGLGGMLTGLLSAILLVLNPRARALVLGNLDD